MGRYDLIGLFDCPWYAKADRIADEIMSQNPNVEFQREMLDSMQWKEFVTNMKSQHGWDIKNSPCIYEILTDREGKARLIGDANDFCEFALLYFDVSLDPSAEALKDLVTANKTAYAFGKGNPDNRKLNLKVFNIAIVNAPLLCLELMLTQLLSPCSMIPNGILLNINIYDEYTPKRILDGLLMEIVDMASPLLEKAKVVTTLPMAFYKCNLFLLMEDFNRTLTEQPKDWLNRVDFKVVEIMNSFNSQETNITNCRILVGGEGPSCYIAEICRKMTPYSISGPGKIIASGQQVIQCAKAELGKIGGIPAGKITRLHAYGWPGMTGCYVEVDDATVRNYSIRGHATEISLAEIATKADYIVSQFSYDFLTLQKERLAYLVKQSNRFMCMAEAAISTIHTWLVCDQLVKLMGMERLAARRMTMDSQNSADTPKTSERSKSLDENQDDDDDDEKSEGLASSSGKSEGGVRRSSQSGQEEEYEDGEESRPRRTTGESGDDLVSNGNVEEAEDEGDIKEGAEDGTGEEDGVETRRNTAKSTGDKTDGDVDNPARRSTAGSAKSKRNTAVSASGKKDGSMDNEATPAKDRRNTAGSSRSRKKTDPDAPADGRRNTVGSTKSKRNSKISASSKGKNRASGDQDDEEIDGEGGQGEVDVSAIQPEDGSEESGEDDEEESEEDSEESTSYGYYDSSYNREGEDDAGSDGAKTPETYLPVVHVGIECPANNDVGFPPGTFMVQPAVCVNGKWQPLGKVSDGTFERITEEVGSLWRLRQMLICRDVNISATFPDYAEVTKEPAPGDFTYLAKTTPQSAWMGDDEEEGGGNRSWYTTDEGGPDSSGYEMTSSEAEN